MNDPRHPSPFFASIHEEPAEQFAWGELRWLCNEKRSAGAALTFGHCRIFPGQVNPLHYHPNCEELLYLLQGQGEHRFEDEWVKLEAGMMIRIPQGVRHALRNTGTEPLECVIAFSSGNRETVFLE